MKTSIDIPEPILQQAKMIAAEEGRTLQELVVSALQNDLLSRSATKDESSFKNGGHHITIDQSGWPLLKREAHDDTVITSEFVNDLREELGAGKALFVVPSK